MKRQVILDTETTGLSPKQGHRLTEIGCLEMIDRQLTGAKFQTYINPERDLDPAALAITGLTAEFLSDKPKFHEVADDFIEFIMGAELIIHNAPFDVGFLDHELSLIKHVAGSIKDHTTIYDTLVVARKLHPGQKNNLDALCQRYRIDNTKRKYHGALLDSEILAKVYLAMTAGQTSFDLNASNNNPNTVKKGKAKIVVEGSLKVIKADSEEIAAHSQYLETIKSASDGVCIWEDDETN